MYEFLPDSDFGAQPQVTSRDSLCELTSLCRDDPALPAKEKPKASPKKVAAKEGWPASYGAHCRNSTCEGPPLEVLIGGSTPPALVLCEYAGSRVVLCADHYCSDGNEIHLWSTSDGNELAYSITSGVLL